ncbi:MAG: hypothetical protein ACPG7F_12270 [Aggregatilineales bacterium]
MQKRKRDTQSLSTWDIFVRGLLATTLLLAIFVLLKEASVDVTDTVNNPHVEAVTAADNTDNLESVACNNEAWAKIMMAAVTGGEITLECNGVIYLENTLLITKDLTIIGSSELITILSGGNYVETMFRVMNGATLTLHDIKIIDSNRYGIYLMPGTMLDARNIRLSGHGSGDSDGAAIWNDGGYVNIEQSVIEHNHSHDDAAGIMNWRNGIVDVFAVSFRDNSAGIEADGTGAAILNYGLLTVENSSFVDNRTPNSTGSAIASLNGTITIENSDFMNNSAAGAAIYNATHSEMTLIDNNFTGNTVNCENHGIVNDVNVCP